MTDAHCHVASNEPVREFRIGRDFVGEHPWASETADVAAVVAGLRAVLAADPSAGVGEIGLDRLRCRDISPAMRELFERQLALAAEFGRPAVLHGAKCWGQVVAACRRLAAGKAPSLLFHGFSRSDGLLPDIVALNGFVSVGPAVLNDHAVNYRRLVEKIPLDRLLVETDRTVENAAECPSVFAVAAKVAGLRGLAADAFETLVDRNADIFRKGLKCA